MSCNAAESIKDAVLRMARELGNGGNWIAVNRFYGKITEQKKRCEGIYL